MPVISHSYSISSSVLLLISFNVIKFYLHLSYPVFHFYNMVPKYLTIATCPVIVYASKSKNVAMILTSAGVINMGYYCIYYYHDQ